MLINYCLPFLLQVREKKETLISIIIRKYTKWNKSLTHKPVVDRDLLNGILGGVEVEFPSP